MQKTQVKEIGMKTCKVCKQEKEFSPEARGHKAQGFFGHVCWSCFLEEQRAWRGTALGREEANEASRASMQRKRIRNMALKDV